MTYSPRERGMEKTVLEVVSMSEGRISESGKNRLPLVGSVRISRDLKTLVLEIQEGNQVKTFLTFVDDVFQVISGYREDARIYGGKIYEAPVFEEET